MIHFVSVVPHDNDSFQVRNDLTFLDLTVQQIEYLNKKYYFCYLKHFHCLCWYNLLSDLVLLSRYDANVPLVLMNSFNTDEDTMKIIRQDQFSLTVITLGSKFNFNTHTNLIFTFFDRKYSGFKVQIKTFNQSRYPRINRESLMPVARSINTFSVGILPFYGPFILFLASWSHIFPRSCHTEDDINAWYPPGHGDFYQV